MRGPGLYTDNLIRRYGRGVQIYKEQGTVETTMCNWNEIVQFKTPKGQHIPNEYLPILE